MGLHYGTCNIKSNRPFPADQIELNAGIIMLNEYMLYEYFTSTNLKGLISKTFKFFKRLVQAIVGI